MKRLSIILISGFIITNSMFSQLRTSIGYNIGLSYQFYQLSDQGDQLLNRPTLISQKGFSIIQDITSRLSAEAGFYGCEYYQFIQTKDGNYLYAGNLRNWQIPIRFRYRFSFFNSRIGISPLASVTLGINRSGQINYPIDSSNSYENTYYFHHTKDSVYEKIQFDRKIKGIFLTAGAGITFDYRFRNGIQIALTGVYNAGLTRLYNAEIDYSVSNAPISHASIYTRGSNLNVWLSLHYPISNFWHKEWKESKYSKIKQSRFYVQAEAGLINTFLKSTGDLDPTIRNGFSIGDCDRSLSLLAGYMVTKHIGIESGYSSMNFTNMYSIKYKSGETGMSFSSGDNGFFMIPATIRYYHFFNDDRMALVPEAGICLLVSKPDVGAYDSTGMNYGTALDDSVVSHVVAYREQKAAVVIKAGLTYEYALAPRIILTLSARYHIGFSDINRLDVENNEYSEIKKGNVFYKGSNLTFSCGIRVPLGREI